MENAWLLKKMHQDKLIFNFHQLLGVPLPSLHWGSEHLTQWLRLWLGCPHLILGCLDWSLGSAADSSFMQTHFGRHHEMAYIAGFLPPTRTLRLHSCSRVQLAQPQPLRATGETTSECNISLTLLLSFSHSLLVSQEK